MDKIKLVVFNEFCLGYIDPRTPDTVSTLVDSVIKGAPFRTFYQPYYIVKNDKVRLASKKDFDDFRVCFEGYDNPEIYEYEQIGNNQNT